jgi:CRISPR/Cas system-associated exonuclease Cas4 (RecB family)
MYLSYTGFTTFRNCKRAYYYKYIFKPILAKPVNRVHMLYGDVVGKLFEKFYIDQIWRNREMIPILLSHVRPILNKVVIQEINKGGVFDWTEPGLKPGTRSIIEVEQEVRESIPRGVRSILRHRLLGVDVGTEVVLNSRVGGNVLAGRADFIIHRLRPYNDLVIIDGKGSRWREKFTDDRQLRWYSMLYQLRNKKIPDHVGFLYWRESEDTSLDWKEVSQTELNDLQNAALEMIKEILELKKQSGNATAVFLATSGSRCQFCDYRQICPEGTRILSVNTKSQIREGAKCGVEEGEIDF